MIIDENKVITAYKSGKSMNAIAKEFEVHAVTIQRILKKHNVEVRHDMTHGGVLYVKDGDKLIEWAKAQKRLVTKAELAAVIGRKKLSPSYFLKYPELGQYVVSRDQKETQTYTQQLYEWLANNNIAYKPNDRTALQVTVDALLLNEYSNIALQITEKPKCVSHKRHDDAMKLKLQRAEKAGVVILFLNKEHFEDLDGVRTLLDALKQTK